MNLTKDEARLLKLAIGIISMEQSILHGELPDATLKGMETRLEKATKEFNELVLKVDMRALIMKLDRAG